MLVRYVSVVATLAGLTLAYPELLTNPKYKGVEDWKRGAADIQAARMQLARAATTTASSTIGSQTNPTDPCFDVYSIPSPTNNPTGPGPDGEEGFGYQAPGSNDVRGPCPALNTLANHGYLPRDGRAINGSTLVSAFLNGWGIDYSVIAIPKTNALSVCTFQSGGSEDSDPSEECEEFDLNVLNTPHVFEHDHSLSRRDYNEKSVLGPSNNHIFDQGVFNESLAVLDNSCYMDIQQANQVRLQRESDQFALDKTGWFTLAPGTQETEIGFIFAVMAEQNQPGQQTGAPIASASVRVDWWQYWFMYESFPTTLGWQVPSPAVQNSFVTSISSMVQSATITSTPAPFIPEFVFGPTFTTPETTVVSSTTFVVNPTLGNLYTTALNDVLAKRAFAEVTPAP